MQDKDPGWSNSEPVQDPKEAQKAHDEETAKAPGAVHLEAGFSNSAPDSPAATPVEQSVHTEPAPKDDEPDEPEPEQPVKKTAAKKSTAKKG